MPTSSASGERGVQQQKAGSQINSTRYKTELCRPFEENGSCKYGEKCQFAHGYHELRSLSPPPEVQDGAVPLLPHHRLLPLRAPLSLHPQRRRAPARSGRQHQHAAGGAPVDPRAGRLQAERPPPPQHLGYSQRDRPKLHHSLSFSASPPTTGWSPRCWTAPRPDPAAPPHRLLLRP
ncbi:unnamed protein product [Pleuronectes platessa]|uniref:mRNA decay activator protein ZFP36 n=1 Tax=Pleuronectes platessa TaxID=8262 RepID=A0A9N7YD57_PLEPL|nr:unnamed protein product [Pleuronectes platessa]